MATLVQSIQGEVTLRNLWAADLIDAELLG
jgi:phage FluMu protein gp41